MSKFGLIASEAAREAISRRSLLTAGFTATAAITLFANAPAAFAQQVRDEIPLDELLADTSLPDIVMGSPDAKVTIVEYASMTCGHCANFHNNVFPQLKEKYIDTGKVRFIKREFPLDNLAAAASMLSRCTGDDEKSSALTTVLFKKRSEWIVRGNPVPRLFDIAKQAGFTQESFNQCLTNQDLLKKISDVRQRASEKFGVSSTPTFFVNGKRLKGRWDQLSTFDALLEPLIDAS